MYFVAHIRPAAASCIKSLASCIYSLVNQRKATLRKDVGFVCDSISQDILSQIYVVIQSDVARCICKCIRMCVFVLSRTVCYGYICIKHFGFFEIILCMSVVMVQSWYASGSPS